jgi:hypothetical protein
MINPDTSIYIMSIHFQVSWLTNAYTRSEGGIAYLKYLRFSGLSGSWCSKPGAAANLGRFR